MLTVARRSAIVAAFTVAALLGAAPVWAAFGFAQTVQSTVVLDAGAEFRFASGGLVRIDLLGTDIVRVRVNPSGTLTTRVSGAIATLPAAVSPAVYDTAGATYMLSSQAAVIVVKSPFQIIILRADGSVVLPGAGPGIGWDSETGVVTARHYAVPGERYFGLGLRGGPIDRRGRQFWMMNVDRIAVGELDDPLYASIPFYYGMLEGRAYGVFVDSPAMPFFDMDSANAGLTTFGAMEGELDYYVMLGPEMWRIAHSYATLTGFPALPPLWTLGYHQSRFGYRSQQEFLDIAAGLRNYAIPSDALHFDLYYLDNLQMFTWHPWDFPNPLLMNATLDLWGFKRVNIIDPVVKTDDQLYPFLAGSRFFLEKADGMPVVNSIFYGVLSWFDFTKQAAADWYKTTLKSFLTTGISAVWNDLNEPAQNFMPEAIYDFNGERRTDRQARNLYALKETELSYAAQRELRPNTRPWVLSRAAYSGIQRYAATWSGDRLSTFESLRISVQMTVSMGLSGVPQFGHDVGGFLGSPTPELFIRWLEFGSMTPFFRNHAMNWSEPREPWVYGQPYLDMARNVINERYRLLPYMYSLFEASSRIGQPVVAPTMFHYPTDPLTYTQDTEFMLGPMLLVAPVLQAGATTRWVYLPGTDRWTDVRTGISYTGGQHVTIDAPLGRVPMFAREGAILPRGPVRQWVSQPVPARMDVDIYPGPDFAYSLYEDDGESFDYEAGEFLRTQLGHATVGEETRFTIERTEGTWTPAPRPWMLTFHQLAVPSSVELNGAPLPFVSTPALLDGLPQGWTYLTGNRLFVKVQDAATPLSVRVRP